MYLIASSDNFADYSSLSSFAATVEDLIEMFIENKMFVNPDKFQAILLDKKKPDGTGTKLTVGSISI